MSRLLSLEGKMFQGRKAVLKNIKGMSSESGKEDISKFKFFFPDEKRKNYNWNENDPSVPMGRRRRGEEDWEDWEDQGDHTHKGLRRHPCKKCDNCLVKDCRKCIFCMDKPKYKGPNIMKQRCKGKEKCLRPHVVCKVCKGGTKHACDKGERLFQDKNKLKEHKREVHGDVRKFRCSDTPRKSEKKSNYVWDDQDPFVAEGWKTTMIPVTGKKVLRKHFLSPDGHFFSSWIKALKFMQKEGIFLKEDIEGMKLGLLGEDWEIDQLPPPGWGVRPNKHNKFVQLSRKKI